MKKRGKQKSNSIFTKMFSYLLCCVVCLSFLTVQRITAFETSPQEVLKIENEAKELSKIWSGDSYRRSIGLFLEAADNWMKLKETSKSSECLRQAAHLYFLLLDYESAEQQLLKAVEIDEKNNNPAGQAKSSSLLSLIFLEKGEFQQSESFYKQSVETSKISGDYSAQAAALLGEAEYSYFRRDADTTVKLYEEALSYGEQSDDGKLLAQILLNLSYAYCKQGDPVLGLKTAKQSLIKWQEIEDERGQAVTYAAIGLAYKMLDEGQNALNAYYSAEVLFPTDMDLIEQARLSTGIASVYINYNIDNIAKNYLQKAYNLYEKAQYLMGQLAVLPFLIKLNYSTNNAALAEKYLEEVKLLSQKLNNGIFMGYTEEVLGNEKLKSGLLEEAVNHYSLALQIFQKYKDKKGTALSYQRLGEAFDKKGMYSTAIENFNLSLNINREIKDKFAEAEILYHLAKIDISQGNEENSLKSVKNSIELTENLYSNVLNSKLKSTYFSNVFDRYELLINLLMKMHERFPIEGYDMQALQASEKSRARSLLETLRMSEANFTKDADPELVQKEKETRTLLNLKADKLTELLSSNADKAETDKLDNEINSLQNELEDIKGKLKANSPVYSAIKNPSAFDVGDFQANILDDKTLLLEFSFGAEESYLWLVGKNEVNHFTLPKREILESRIQKLLDLLKAREISANEEPESYQKRLFDAESEFEREARLLSRELFGQIGDKLTGKRLIIVPDGKLSYFPISALPLPNSTDNEPMLQTNEIVYEPSAATLQILGKSKHIEKLSPKELLVFADPIFSLQDNRLLAENKNPTDENEAAFLGSSLRSFEIADSNNQLARLFATQQEADAIVKIVGAENATIVSGFAANRQRVFEKDISDYKIIHFATHGLMNDTRPELSGVVLSLFDEKGEAQKGFIRLQDIYSLDLSADLVVLSACQSGIGKEVKGEGLMSLTGGFIQSGANSVLSSLWKVDDYATAELMKNFYQELSTKNLVPSQALQTAQIKMRQNPNFKSPFYWAAFTVQGEFRQPISVNTNRFSYLWIVLTTIFVGLVIWFVIRFVKAR